jgi:hypothetical protein
MRIALPVISSLFILGLAVSAPAADAPPPVLNDLALVPNSKIKLAYAKPGIDWKKFRTLQIRTLSIPPDVRDGSPPGASRQYRESYVLGEKEVKGLQDAYMDVMRDKLGAAGYTFVDTPGPDTLIVITQVTAIRLSAPIERTRMTYASRGNTFSESGGAIAIAAALGDGQTGNVIAQVADSRWPTTQMWGVNNRVTNMRDARQIFGYWANALKNRLQSGSDSP